jgi:hypothetical protein
LLRPNVLPSGAQKKDQQSSDTASDQQLADMLAATHPVLLTITGGGGLALILWLMMFKPF